MARKKTDPKTKGKGKGNGKEKKESKTISPYYATQMYGTEFEKATSKASMANFFSGKSPANKRGESEAQHMARQAKKDTIPSARKARGIYNIGSAGDKSVGKRMTFNGRKKR